MRAFRAALALLLALLWVPMTNSCLLASAWPGVFPSACACEAEDEGCGDSSAKCEDSDCEHEGTAPKQQRTCPAQDCAPCATLESGVNLVALMPATVPPASWRELTHLAETLRLLEQRAEELLSEPPPVPPPSPPHATRDIVTMALPVRGPSLIA